MALLNAESWFTGDIPHRKLRIPSGVMKKIFWNTMKWWMSISDLQEVWTNWKGAMKKYLKKVLSDSRNLLYWKILRVSQSGGKKGWKHYSTDRSVRPWSLHHEVYKSLFGLWVDAVQVCCEAQVILQTEFTFIVCKQRALQISWLK